MQDSFPFSPIQQKCRINNNNNRPGIMYKCADNGGSYVCDGQNDHNIALPRKLCKMVDRTIPGCYTVFAKKTWHKTGGGQNGQS